MLNRVRLPFYLSKPQYPAEEDVYLKGNGRRVVLKAIVNKVMDGKTDWMPSPLHERLSIALRHDEVNIESDKYTGSVKLVGAYDIDWSDFLDYPFAPAAFKAFEEAFVARSNRCDICEETNYLTLFDDELGTLEEGSINEVNVADNDSICCSDPVFSIFSYDTDYIDSISISQAGVVSFTLKSPLASVPDKSLFTYKVVCGDLEETADVTATIEGSLTPLCEAPDNLLLFNLPDSAMPFEIHAQWDEPTGGPPTDGYEWLLKMWPEDITIASGTTTDVEVDINGLDCEQDYRFYVRAVCDLATEYYSAYIYDNILIECDLDLPEFEMVVSAVSEFSLGNDIWKVHIDIVSPLGVELDEDFTAYGNIIINGTPYPYSVTLPALSAHGETAAIDTVPNPSTGTLDPTVYGTPIHATGTDAIEYTLIVNT